MTDFSRTRAALALYDAGEPEREARWQAAMNNEDVKRVQALELADLKLVQEAFFEDTKPMNSREHCSLVDIATARKFVAAGEARAPRTPAPGKADPAGPG